MSIQHQSSLHRPINKSSLGGRFLAIVAAFAVFWGACYLASSSARADERGGETNSGLQYRAAAQPLTAPEIYGQGVRETNWQSPDQERSGFHLPPGFKIALFAAEPQIAKPLNMAWDAKGRLWISNTVEYPYPAEEQTEARDSIKILEDTTGDGRADKVLTFADGLNIPMGILPVHDGVICFSIPYIWHLKDNDGDDRVDERIRLLGPFDTTRDTHGMVNALRRGVDGWIYACHGFNNQSTVTAGDGSSVTLVSGNTFRFREDGSSVELFTSGQVNPFGMTQDEFGHWCTADCHSKPITALIQGGFYPSFGRPHDGLGFAPSMMEHLHGSTAISGLCYYRGSQFPAAYRGLLYSGNVMTSRINCNRLDWQGATARAVELPDFLTSDDPWFRPVDIRLGPDGNLYVADFYNKIIGHYEVPLTHPGRDRTSGRIWRISYVGSSVGPGKASNQTVAVTTEDIRVDKTDLPSATDVSFDPLTINPVQVAAKVERFVEESNQSDLALKQQLREAEPAQAVVLLQVLHRRSALDKPTVQHLLQRFGRLEQDELDASERLALSILWCKTCQMAEHWSSDWQSLVLESARRFAIQPTCSAHVRRSAVALIGQAGSVKDIDLLLGPVSDWHEDPALRQVTRIALRSLLRSAEDLPALLANYRVATAGEEAGRIPMELADILPGLASTDAAIGLLQHLANSNLADAELTGDAMKLLIDNPPETEEQLLRSLRLIRRISGPEAMLYAERLADLAQRYTAYRSKSELAAAGRALGQQISALLREDLIPAFQKRFEGRETNSWMDHQGRAWPLQSRPSDDGQARDLMSSHALGEDYTGVLCSESFRCPPKIEFWLAGHNGQPSEADKKQCRVRLVAATSGLELQSAFPPRSDTARSIAWDTQDWTGQEVRIEVVDRNNDAAYAWLAVGDFDLDVLNRSDFDSPVQALITLLETGMASEVEGELHRLLDAMPPESRIRASLLAAAVSGQGRPLLRAMIDFAVQLGQASVVPNDYLTPTAMETETLNKLAQQLCSVATLEQQAELAAKLSGSTVGCKLMDALIVKGVLASTAVAALDTGALPDSLPKDVRERLTAAIESAKSNVERTIDLAGLLSTLNWTAANSTRGQQIFAKQCANCHQLGGEGSLVGPQLDGAVARSYQRLLQDILLPDQNVDQAFRQSAYLLEGDVILSGLGQTQANGSVRLTFQDGTSLSLTKEQIVDQKQLSTSLMPNNFRELLSDSDLASLLRYMASFRPAAHKTRQSN